MKLKDLYEPENLNFCVRADDTGLMYSCTYTGYVETDKGLLGFGFHFKMNGTDYHGKANTFYVDPDTTVVLDEKTKAWEIIRPALKAPFFGRKGYQVF